MESNFDYKQFVKPILYREFDKASPFDSKNIIQQKVLKEIAHALDVCIPPTTSSSNKVFVHPYVCTLIENLYKQILMGDVKVDSLTMKFSMFKSSANDLYEITLVKNLIKEFQKCLEVNKDANKKDKILRDNRLNIIMGIDGFQGALPTDLCNYIQNLGVGNAATKVNERHVLGVRAMYEMLPSVLTGTDSTYILTKALLHFWATKNLDQDKNGMIEREIEVIDDYLLQMSQCYKEIETAVSPAFIGELIRVYKTQVQEEADLMNIATERLSSFWNYLKKKQQQNENIQKKQQNENIQKKKQHASEEDNEPESKKKAKKRPKINVEWTPKDEKEDRKKMKTMDLFTYMKSAQDK